MLQIPEAPIFRLLESFMNSADAGDLLLASAALVTLNTVRAVPLYVGWFYLGESLKFGGLLPPLAIPLSYYVSGLISGGRHLHFGTPAILGIATVLILQLLIRSVPGRFNRTVALCLFLFSFQWLDLAPFLTQHGFGRGELSLAIKNIASLSGYESVLDLLAVGGFAVAFVGALMAAALLVNIDLNARQYRRLTAQNKTLAALREESLRARMTREIQSLVHDLRRPLTSIQGLADVLALIAEDGSEREYAERISVAAENMGRMVGEILHEDGRSLIDARELLDYTMSQISPLPWHRYVQAGYAAEDVPPFYGNRIRIARALVNLMENAAHAVRDVPVPHISIRYFLEGSFVRFSVRDNGPGVSANLSVGSSGHGSTGLGLAVAQSVAENHEGTFLLQNHPDGGAEALLSIALKEEQE